MSATGSTDTTTTSNLWQTITKEYPLDLVWHNYLHCDEETWNLLDKGEGLLERAQKARISLNGVDVCKGKINGLMNKTEFQKLNFKTVCPECKWNYIVHNEHFHEISPIDELIGLTGAGGCYSENISKYFTGKKVGLIVNATSEVPMIIPNPKNPDEIFSSYRIPVDDNPSENLYKFFEEVLPLMHEQINKGNVVIVHCWRGVSRSAAIVMAYLMKYQNLSVENAYKKMKLKRPFMRPSLNFLRQLTHYEAELHREVVTKWRPIMSSYKGGPNMAIWFPAWIANEIDKKESGYSDEFKHVTKGMIPVDS